VRSKGNDGGLSPFWGNHSFRLDRKGVKRANKTSSANSKIAKEGKKDDSNTCAAGKKCAPRQRVCFVGKIQVEKRKSFDLRLIPPSEKTQGGS